MADVAKLEQKVAEDFAHLLAGGGFTDTQAAAHYRNLNKVAKLTGRTRSQVLGDVHDRSRALVVARRAALGAF